MQAPRPPPGLVRRWPRRLIQLRWRASVPARGRWEALATLAQHPPRRAHRLLGCSQLTRAGGDSSARRHGLS